MSFSGGGLRAKVRFAFARYKLCPREGHGTSHTDYSNSRSCKHECASRQQNEDLSPRWMHFPSWHVVRHLHCALRDHPDAQYSCQRRRCYSGTRGVSKSSRGLQARRKACLECDETDATRRQHRHCKKSLCGIALLWVWLLCQRTAANIVVDAPVSLSPFMISILQILFFMRTPCLFSAHLRRL